MSAIKHIENRKVYIDFGEFHDYRITADKDGPTAYQLATVIGPRRRFKSPEQLQHRINAYFDSCRGMVLTKNGLPVLNPDGSPLIRIVQPLTVSGLARHLGVTTRALMDYKYQVIQQGIPDEYLPILSEARQRIEEYAEGRLYDMDGSRGAQFSLSAAFGWETPKERSDRKNAKARTSLMSQEQKLKQSMFDKDDEGGLSITIVRAGRRNSLPDGLDPTEPIDVTDDAVDTVGKIIHIGGSVTPSPDYPDDNDDSES